MVNPDVITIALEFSKLYPEFMQRALGKVTVPFMFQALGNQPVNGSWASFAYLGERNDHECLLWLKYIPACWIGK
jgi:hypothetical protein